jgi:cytoskeletal protein CcmA (bactofilin family)
MCANMPAAGALPRTQERDLMALLLRRARNSTTLGRDAAEPAASHLAKALMVTGILDTDGELHIHGNVAGRINADHVVLLSGACMEGDIVARVAQIGGRLIGRIFALNVILESSANITGRIFHHTVTVARGARIEGRMPWRPPSFFETLTELPETQP